MRLLAGVLPAWDASEPGETAPRRCANAVKLCLQVAQRKAAAIMAHGRKVRAAHAEQMRARSSSREWMRLAVRAWREEVEHSKAMSRERWKVRCVGDPPRRNRGQSMQILGSADMLTGSRRGSVQRMEGGNRAGSSAGAAEDRTSDGQKQPRGHAGRRAEVRRSTPSQNPHGVRGAAGPLVS